MPFLFSFKSGKQILLVATLLNDEPKINKLRRGESMKQVRIANKLYNLVEASKPVTQSAETKLHSFMSKHNFNKVATKDSNYVNKAGIKVPAKIVEYNVNGKIKSYMCTQLRFWGL
jgi:formate-dependent nitrite reductase cytochrome c552 subunit